MAEYVAGLGLDGINIEDSSAGRLIAPAAHAAKVAAIKRRVPELFVNARVDTYWLGQDPTVAATLERAAAYVDAGADGAVPAATPYTEMQERLVRFERRVVRRAPSASTSRTPPG